VCPWCCSPVNAHDYCLGCIGRDRVCLLQKGLCDVAKHERHKVEVKEPMIHIMTPATKQTKFAAYETPDLAVDLLTDLQYADLIREHHPVAEWNHILLAIKEGNFENKSEFNEIKLRATRKPAFSKSFTPRKKVKFVMGGFIEDVDMLDMGDSYDVKATLQPRAMENKVEPWILAGKEWQAMCAYVQMLDSKLSELQDMIATSKAAVTDRLMILEDELGAVMADVGPGNDVPGGAYANVWSGVGTALENNQAVATVVGKIAQQVTTTSGRLKKLVAKANRVTSEEGQLRAQVLSLNHSQRAEETKTNQIVDQLHTLALLLNQIQQDVQQHKLKEPNNAVLPERSPNLMMPQGVPIEDTVLQLQIELQVVQSRLSSDTAVVGGYTFESYEDTLKWATANCSAQDWQYVMDIPALYSLVRPDGQEYDVLLQEQSDSSRAGFASSMQSRLDLSFNTNVPGIFGADKAAKNGHPFADIDTYDKWVSLGIRQGFRKCKNRPRLWSLHFQSK
jgi:hypothetical protein